MKAKDVKKWHEEQLKRFEKEYPPKEEIDTLDQIVNSLVLAIPLFAVFTYHWLGYTISILWGCIICFLHVELQDKITKLEKKLSNKM